ncbi:acylphosphatase [Roseomonas sp. F4]
MTLALLLAIEGRVQGVGYRDWMRRQARRFGVAGWVRNRPDGSVQALVAGPTDSVRALIAACHRGPMLARVTRVTETPGAPPESEDFQRLADG